MGSRTDHEGGVHVIYPGGDTIFLCGPDKVKLLVHSIFLTNASKVFAAMLGPFFREGQPQTNSGPREIPLPEDDPFSMQVIFGVIHSRREDSHDEISPKQLSSIAYTADKYDLVSTLKYASSYWFSSLKTPGQSLSIETHLDIMKAAYLLENERGLQMATSAIVLDYTRPFSNLSSHFEDVMPQETILILEEKRNKIRLDIIQLLWMQGDTLQDQNHQTKPRQWMELIERNSLFPEGIVKFNLSEAITKVKQICKPEVLQGNRISMTTNSQLRLLETLERLRESTGISLGSLHNRT